jgi:hypothetical protein
MELAFSPSKGGQHDNQSNHGIGEDPARFCYKASQPWSIAKRFSGCSRASFAATSFRNSSYTSGNRLAWVSEKRLELCDMP